MPTASEFHYSVPALLSPFLGFIAYSYVLTVTRKV